MVARPGGCGQIFQRDPYLPRHFVFARYPARFIDICSCLDLLCHAGAPPGRSMISVFFESFCDIRGHSSSCLVSPSFPRLPLSPRAARRITGPTQRRHPSKHHVNEPAPRAALPAQVQAAVAPRTGSPRAVAAATTIPSARAQVAKKSVRISVKVPRISGVVAISVRVRWLACINFVTHSWLPLNYVPWHSS